MPRLVEAEEFGLTPEEFNVGIGSLSPTNTKVNLLRQKKQEKLNTLGTKVGAADNQMLNNLSGAEYQYLVGRSAQELAQPQDAYGEGNRWLYSYGTDEGKIKLGTARGDISDPDARYNPELGQQETGSKYGWEAGPEGVNTGIPENRMKLLFPEQVANTLEHLGHGREEALDARTLVKPQNPDEQFWQEKEKLGGGYTEYYSSKEGFYGDSRDDADFDKEELWDRFLVTTGQKEPQELSTSYENQYIVDDSDNPFERLRQTALQRESSGNYRAINDKGYVGGYQFGAQALEDLGYLKKGASSKGNNILAVEQAWTGKGGVNSLQEFLSNPEAQDIAFEENLDTNYQRLVDAGVLDQNASKEEIGGRLLAAHLLGAQGSANLAATDAYGTSGQEYYQLGRKAVLGEIEQPSRERMSIKEQLTRQNMAEREGFDKVLYEGAQTVASIIPSAMKGAIELADAGQEFLTWPVQSAVRAITGDEEYDIDLISDEFKKYIVGEVDETFGYNRLNDEIEFENTVEEFKKSGIDITSWESIKEGLADPEKRKHLSEGALMAAANPSFLFSMIAEVVGAGVGLGTAVKVLGKATNKVAPELVSIAAKIGKRNIAKLKDEIKVVKASSLSGAEKTARIEQIEKSYTLSKRLPDILKGNTYTNSDLAIRMNEDIEAFEANNQDEDTPPEKIFQSLVLNRIASSLEIGALKYQAKIGKIGKEAAEQSLKRAVVDSSLHILGSSATEAVQEIFDGVVQQLNQKLGSADYEDKSLKDILSDASAEILAGGALGASGGGYMGGLTEATKGLRAGGQELGARLEARKQDKEAATEEEIDTAVEDEYYKGIGKVIDFMSEGEALNKGNIKDVISGLESAEINKAAESKLEPKQRENAQKARQVISEQVKKFVKDNPDLELDAQSTTSAERVINLVLGSGPVDESTISDLDKFAKTNKISKERFDELVKNYESVREEATIGPRGYETVGLRMRSNLDSGDVDTKQLDRDYQQLVKFRNSTDESIRNLERGIEEAKQVADQFNRSKAPTPKKAKRIKTEYRKDDGTLYNIDVVIEKGRWKAKVEDATERLEEKKTTRRNINAIVNEVSGKGSEFLSTPIASDSVIIPTDAATKETSAARKSDSTYVRNISKTIKGDLGRSGNVNKVILDDKATEKWKANSDYRKLNSPLINSGEYTSEDVVLLNAMDKIESKKEYGKAITALRDEKSEAGQEIRKAIDAGATIALDREYNTPAYKEAKELVKKYLESKGYIEVPRKNYFVKKDTSTEEFVKQVQEQEKQRRSNEQSIRTNTGIAKNLLAEYRKEKGKDVESKFNDKVEEIAKLSGDSKETVLKDIQKRLQEDVKNATDLLEGINKGLNDVAELEDINKNILKLAEEKLEKRQEKDLSTGTILDQWKVATEKERLSGQELIDRVKELVKGITKPMQVGKDLLDKALGKDKKPVWEEVYVEEVKDSRGNWVSTGTYEKALLKEPTKEEIRTFSDGNAKYVGRAKTKRRLPVGIRKVHRDATKMISVKRPTVINTLGVENLTEDLRERAEAFSRLVKRAITPKSDTKMDAYNLYNSPARALVYDNEGQVIPEVALAMDLSIGELFETDMFKLMTGGKTDVDIARMFRVDQRNVTKEMREFARDKGILRKTVADTIGKSVMTRLGFGINTEAEMGATEYKALIADLGNVAILAAEKAGWVEDVQASSNDFAKLLGGGKEEVVDKKVSFVTVPATEGPKKEPKSKALVKNMKSYELATANLPERKTGEVWPELKKLNKKAMEKQLSEVRNDITGTEVAKEAKETLTHMMNTPYVFDTDRIDEFLKLVDDREGDVKALLGYIEEGSSEYEKLTFDDKEIQESINREVDRSIEVLREFRETVDSGKTELYFKFFYSGNGRYMMDSNTINPQTNKLHRFLVQPKAHENTFTTEDGLIFKDAEGNDTSFHVREALAQAMGVGIDKAGTEDKIAFGNALLSMNKKQRDDIKEALLVKGKAKFWADGTEFEAEAEHLSHMLQAFDFLDQVQSGEVTSSITAEYDSLTSGYNNKLQQFPVLDDMPTELAKVGIMTETYLDTISENGDSVFNPANGKAVNDVFANGKRIGFYDSYQTLAKKVLEKLAPLRDALDYVGYRMFDGIEEALPGGIDIGNVDAVVSGALRSLFKDPFMIFNYSAAIKTIRKNLGNELAVGLMKDIAKLDLKDTESAEYKAAEFLTKYGIKGVKKGDVASLQRKLRNERLDRLVTTGQKSQKLVDRIAKVMDKTYGQAVEDTFNDKFKKFMEIQDATNDAFKVMFRLFDAKRMEMLKAKSKDGLVTKKDHADILTELWDTFPYIVGPLTRADNKKDVISVLDTGTGTPRSAEVSRRAPQTGLPEKSSKGDWWASRKINPMVKQMQEAMQAGSVIPFHFIDGAELGGMLNEFVKYLDGDLEKAGIIPIHDAVMAKLGYSDRVVWEYNKKVFETNKNYSIMQSINEMMNRGSKELDSLKERNTISTDGLSEFSSDEGKHAVKKMSFQEVFKTVQGKVSSLNEEINTARNKLYEVTLKGAYFGNMIGSPASIYVDGKDFDMSYTSQYEGWYNKTKDIEIVKEESKAKEASDIVDLDEPTTNINSVSDAEVDAILAKAEKAKKDTPKKCIEL